MGQKAKGTEARYKYILFALRLLFCIVSCRRHKKTFGIITEFFIYVDFILLSCWNEGKWYGMESLIFNA